MIFPTAAGRGMNCAVAGGLDLAPQTGNVASLIARMRNTTPHGGTPTDVAFGVAASALQDFRAGSNARALVLATDGAPNCNPDLDPSTCTCVGGGNCRRSADMCLDDTRTVATIGSYAKEGLPTYVIGIADADDSQFVSVLDAMAEAGGRPLTDGAHSYYSADSPSDLQAALLTIRDQVGACAFLTSSVPSASGTIVVMLGGQPIPFDPTNGWSWGNEANGEILLHGSACDAALVHGGTSNLVAEVTCGEAVDAGDAGDGGMLDAAEGGEGGG